MAVDLGYDESGEVGGDVLVVSMQIGRTEKVRRLNKLWKKELAKAKVPFFHSKDYGNYTSGVFRDLPRQRRKLLLERLAQLARLRFDIGISAAISQSQYIANTDQDWRSKWAAPYSFLVAILTLSAQVYVKHMNLGYEANVLVESGHRNAGQVLDILRTLADTPKMPEITPLKILSYGLGSKKDHPILQAADMLAFSEWQSIIDGGREIYDEFHVNESKYRTEFLDNDACMTQLAIMQESTRRWEKQKGKEEWLRRQNKAKPNSTNSTMR
jgi:hypothetical protein